MPEPSTLLVFAGASIAMLVFPGPSVVYIVTRGVEQGRRAGLMSMLGVEAGALVHVAAAALGISAIVASSATAFSIVKYAGAAYLIYLGVQRWRNGESAPETAEPQAHRDLFRQGMVVNVLNPKTAIFFLAFLPQFVDPSMAVAPQALVLGAEFIAIAVVSDGAYALLAGTLGERIRSSALANRWVDRAAGGTLVALGGLAALSGGPDDHHRARRVV
jgi:threonine/homoserine/homoserine lactone efflux protein